MYDHMMSKSQKKKHHAYLLKWCRSNEVTPENDWTGK